MWPIMPKNFFFLVTEVRVFYWLVTVFLSKYCSSFSHFRRKVIKNLHSIRIGIIFHCVCERSASLRTERKLFNAIKTKLNVLKKVKCIKWESHVHRTYMLSYDKLRRKSTDLLRWKCKPTTSFDYSWLGLSNDTSNVISEGKIKSRPMTPPLRVDRFSSKSIGDLTSSACELTFCQVWSGQKAWLV